MPRGSALAGLTAISIVAASNISRMLIAFGLSFSFIMSLYLGCVVLVEEPHAFGSLWPRSGVLLLCAKHLFFGAKLWGMGCTHHAARRFEQRRPGYLDALERN